jgi:hypothetical protein
MLQAQLDCQGRLSHATIPEHHQFVQHHFSRHGEMRRGEQGILCGLLRLLLLLLRRGLGIGRGGGRLESGTRASSEGRSTMKSEGNDGTAWQHSLARLAPTRRVKSTAGERANWKRWKVREGDGGRWPVESLAAGMNGSGNGDNGSNSAEEEQQPT